MGTWSSTRHEEDEVAVQEKVKLLTDRDVPFEELVPGLELARAITSAGSTQLGGGYMRFTQDAEFAGWTLTYDEVLFVQAGELTVASDGGNTVARAGEAILIPRGAKVTYRGRAGTVSFFVLWPFDWNKKVDRLTKGVDTGRA
jgi:ethanolamine utilization protein EutQ (cupin superfamily)